MAFIEKIDPTVLNIKLTSTGRSLLAKGELNFKYFTVGDSEINYEYIEDIKNIDSSFTHEEINVLRPTDTNPKPVSFITETVSGDTYNSLSTIPTKTYNVTNTSKTVGFFDDDGESFLIDLNHVKQPDLMINMSTLSGGSTVLLEKSPNYGNSGYLPEIGDLLLIRWALSEDTTGYTINKEVPTAHLMYKIVDVSGYTVTLDRDVPTFQFLGLSTYAGAMLFSSDYNYTGNTTTDYLSSDYLDDAVLAFYQNYQCGIETYPFWNLDIVYTENLVGVGGDDKKYLEFKSRGYGGFVDYIQNYDPTTKRIGIVHYSNQSPANTYGEGFNGYTPTLNLPLVMWHKSETHKMGVKLSPIGSVKQLINSDIRYYDLVDELGFIVGKVFIDLKIFIIEDQELLNAMSYKSNRNWTIPDFTASVQNTLPECPSIVTWNLPTFDGETSQSMEMVQQYCHSETGWVTFNEPLTLVNVSDVGYKVTTGDDNPLLISTTVCITARDYTTNNIVASTCVVGTNNTISILENIVDSNTIYFDSTIKLNIY